MESLADRFVAETRQRLDAVFAAWAGGSDVPPGDRLRLEGFMQAGISLGLATREQMVACIAQSCRQHFGVNADLPSDDLLPEQFPPMADPTILPLPPMMRRAPVVPSTRE